MPAASKRSKIIGVKWISRDEAAATVDSHARRVLNVSGARFVSNWKSGMYRTLDADQCPGVIELALMAPLPKTARAGENRKRSGR